MLLNTTSLSIILRQYKEGNLSEEEASQLIEDLYNKNNNYIYPYYPQPAITWDTNTPDFRKFEITCSI